MHARHITTRIHMRMECLPHPASIARDLLLYCMQLCQLITEGKLRPTIDQVFPLASAAEAHEKGEEGHVRGKLVLHVADLKA